MSNEQARLDWVIRSADAKAPTYVALSDEIWEYAELRFQEHKAVAAQCAILQAEGFRVTRGLAGMPTAFVAEAGSGSPVIGFLGEYDALAGLSQQAGAAEPRAVRPGDA